MFLARNRFVSYVALFAVCRMCNVVVAFDDRLDDVMYQDPVLSPLETKVVFSEDLKPVWLEALAQPDSELQRLAADTIALAHRSGMPNLRDTAKPLLALFQQDELDPTVRNALARALVELDAHQAAESFGETMQASSLEIATIIEPALARWDYVPARDVWRATLSNLESERVRMVLAIGCLGTVKDSKATLDLLEFVKDSNAELPARLAAARASARINSHDLLPIAEALSHSEASQLSSNLLAVTLLNSAISFEAISILKRLASNDSAVVSGLALRRLFEIDPSHVDALATSAIDSRDVNVRRVGCESLVHQAKPESIAHLGTMLNDVNLDLRRYVARSLIHLAEREPLREPIFQATLETVSKDSWRGLEQGLIVLGSLDHEPAAPRMIELLPHRRPEVAVAAGWGLRMLAVVDTLPAALDRSKKLTKAFETGSIKSNQFLAADGQMSQLFQMFGSMMYKEAEPTMRKFIPKTFMTSSDSRLAAIWAIGKLHNNQPDETLAKQFAKRLADVDSLEPELASVRRMTAIGIGRMKAESQLKTIRQFLGEAPGDPGQACVWSLKQMTGEIYEYSLVRQISSTDWFLTPISKDRPKVTD